MKRLALALVTASLAGLLCTALAQTNPRLVHRSWFTRGPLLTGSIHLPPAPSGRPVSTYHISLRDAQVARPTNGQVVVTMRASGDLPGVLTMQLELDSTRQYIVGGEWTLVVSYIQDLPANEPNAAVRFKNNEEHEDSGGEILVQKGVVKGAISSGTVTLNTGGAVVSINSLQLNISGGTVSYDGVTEGNGTAQAAYLQDLTNSVGTLDLSF
jgi:hypothetical protein